MYAMSRWRNLLSVVSLASPANAMDLMATVVSVAAEQSGAVAQKLVKEVMSWTQTAILTNSHRVRPIRQRRVGADAAEATSVPALME